MSGAPANSSIGEAAKSDRTFLDTQTPKNEGHAHVNVWSVEYDKDGNLVYRPPASQLVEQMCLDTNGPFGQPRLAAEAPIGKEVLEIQQFTLGQALTRK
jgi:hypothetical protein